MPRIPKTTRIAVTGIAGGGKTVFLTTLLSHLAEYNVENADGFGSIPEIFRFHELRGKRWPEFRLHEHRQSLARGTWPEKSVDCSQFVVQYDRSDWRFRSQRLELFDFPGERIADAAVAALGSYDDWSDHILDHFVHNQDYSDVAQSYLTYISSGKLTEHELLHTYRFILASLILQYKPLISPSTFLLDQRGGKARPGTPDEIASERFCGTSSESQFAPLSKEARESNPELTKYMRRVFADYRKTVALPIFNELGRAQRLVILVDIPTLLAGGVGRFNDERQILIDLFDVLRPNSQLGELLRGVLKYFVGSLDRVAFVAAKADMVHPEDIADGRLEALLKDMTSRARNLLPGVEFQWFTCSACRSTYPADSGRKLKGRPIYDNPERKTFEYEVPELPEYWPDEWHAGDFHFSKVYPHAPKNLSKPPAHINLDRVFKFITE